MPLYAYTAFDKTNKEIKNQIEAANEQAASRKLREMGLRPVDIKLTKEKSGAGGLFGGSKIKEQEIATFTRQMATLLDSGMPLLRGINLLAEQNENLAFKKVLTQIGADITSGKSFSEALAAHPKLFDKLYINMIKAGEVGGVLETVMDRLALFKEKDLELKMKIKGALTYPAIMALVAISVVTFLLVGVLPTFVEMFISMKVELPLPTKIVIATSDILKNFWYLVLMGIFGAGFGIKQYRKTPEGLYKTDQIKLKFPVFGKLMLNSAVARFTRTLGTLIQSGVPIIQALSIVRETVGNEHIARAFDKVVVAIKEGESMSKPLHE
ncbi:MAG TPA: type II secretion system F family protein, partial [bacterium]|nr:type II secretion system F family protein [bacterium]